MEITYPATATSDDVIIQMTFIEAIGLYLLVLGLTEYRPHPDGPEADPFDVGEVELVRSALQVQLAEVVGP